MKKDSKIKSLTESIFNIFVGIVVAFLSNMIVLPLFGMPFSISSFSYIALIYTGISLARSYIIRRMFVNGFYADVVVKLLNIFPLKTK